MTALFQNIAVVGGGGYVGSALVPYLLEKGYQIKVIDLFMYGENVFGEAKKNPRLRCVKADVRNEKAMEKELQGMDAVIHLACVSNDPSFELDPDLGKSINYDAFRGLIKAVKTNRISRLIYASSSSVYGVKQEPNVTEDMSCEPLTDYSKYKLLCEKLLASEDWGNAEYVVIRPATVCGYAPRLRLDLSVNILTIHALVKKEITVFGGAQLRPNINIRDMIEAYRVLLEAPKEKIHREVFNAGYENLSISRIAELVKNVVKEPDLKVTVKPTNDPRSYHVNSDKIRRVLGFKAHYTVEEAIQSIADAYRAGMIPNALTDPTYVNIKTMQAINLKNPFEQVTLLHA